MEDILTISADRAGLITSIREALNLVGRKFLHYTTTTEEQAEQIHEMIAITPRNSDLLEGAFPALPCIIEFADGGIVKCLAGKYRQMEFLLGALRRAYPREYDAYQQLREGSFQTAVEGLLGSSFSHLEMRRNIRLRSEGRVLTDVDLAVIDPQQGLLLLIQLKFQDVAGGDFRVEASRMSPAKHLPATLAPSTCIGSGRECAATLAAPRGAVRGCCGSDCRKAVDWGRPRARSRNCGSMASDCGPDWSEPNGGCDPPSGAENQDRPRDYVSSRVGRAEAC